MNGVTDTKQMKNKIPYWKNHVDIVTAIHDIMSDSSGSFALE